MAPDVNTSVTEDEEDVLDEQEVPGYESITVGTSYEDPNTGQESKMEVTIQIFVGKDLDSAREKFGEDVVYERYLRGIKKDAGNSARARLNHWLGQLGQPNAPELDEIPYKVQDEHNNWEPGVTRRRGRRPKELTAAEFLANFDLKSPEEQQAILAEIMAKVNG